METNKTIIMAIVFLAVLVFFPCLLTAQPPPPNPGGDPDMGVPINALVGIALVLGACFGAGKLGEK